MQCRISWLAPGCRAAAGAILLLLSALLALPGVALAADPLRGASLFATPARPGLLTCADCHSEDPIANNFGNIWSGRNAVSLIQRAVQNNTGGMGIFLNLYDATDLADIAAYLGNAPNALAFAPTTPGATSPAQRVTISSSLKLGIDALRLTLEGEFVLVDTTCGTSVPRFSSCAVDLAYGPRTAGPQIGALIVEHAGTPTPIRLPLTGEGPPQARAVATLAPDSVDFAAGVGTRRNVVLSNDSAEPLRIERLSIAPAGFIIAGGSCVPGLVLATGEQCLIALRLDGSVETGLRGALTVAHDGLDGRSTVLLQAAPAAAADWRADRVALQFGARAVGTRSAPQLVTLSNAGRSALVWREIVSSDPAFVIERSSCAGTLAPQQHCQLAVSFTGARAGRANGELRVVGQDGRPQWRLPVSGQTGEGALRATPPRLAWRAQTGQRITQDLVLVNDADGPADVSAPSIDGPQAGEFALAGGSCISQGFLPPGASCVLTVAFSPTQAGPRNARLQVAALSVPLAAQAFATTLPSLWLDASAIDFGDRAVGSATGLHRVTVFNRGAAPLSWRALTIAGSHAADFVTAGDCRIDQALAPHSACQAEIGFAPAGIGNRMATAVLWPQGADKPALLTIRGVGVRAATAALLADALALDFGTQPRSVPLPTRRVQLLNRGSAALAAPVLHVDGPFRIVSVDRACITSLAPGQSCAVDVALSTDLDGAVSGELTVQSAGNAPLVLPLAGRRSNEASALDWMPSNEVPALETAPVGTASGLTSWTLVNRGNAPSAPLRWTLDGPAAEDFSVDASSSCIAGTLLAPGARCDLRTAFHPSAGGLRTARLLLRDNDTASALPLQGRGLAPAFAVLRAWPDAVSFQARVDAATTPQALVLANEGAAAAAFAEPGSTSAAFTSSADARSPCGAAVPDLLPGETCGFDLSWTGSAAGQSGGSFVAIGADALASATVPLTVKEDPAQRSNVGTGGGALSVLELLALAFVSALLWSTRTKSGHA